MTTDLDVEWLAHHDTLAPSFVPAEPWANGGGTTRVLLHEFTWRLSVAAIDGANSFSHFPGWDRLLLVTGEQPLTLTIEGQTHTLAPGDAVHFAGEDIVTPAPTSARVTVINVMTQRSSASLRWERLELTDHLAIPADGTSTVVVGGSVALEGITLPHGTLLLPSTQERLLTGDGILVALTTAPATSLPAI